MYPCRAMRGWRPYQHDAQVPWRDVCNSIAHCSRQATRNRAWWCGWPAGGSAVAAAGGSIPGSVAACRHGPHCSPAPREPLLPAPPACPFCGTSRAASRATSGTVDPPERSSSLITTRSGASWGGAKSENMSPATTPPRGLSLPAGLVESHSAREILQMHGRRLHGTWESFAAYVAPAGSASGCRQRARDESTSIISRAVKHADATASSMQGWTAGMVIGRQ